MNILSRVLSSLFPDPIYPKYIDKDALEDCLNAAQGTHPNEFLALLVAEHSSNIDILSNETIEDEYVITSYYVIPGTKSTPMSASINSANIPVSGNIVGSFHSHPNGTTQPSPEDSNMFRKYPINIIAGAPYTKDTWQAYGPESEPTNITIIETDSTELDSIWEQEFENLR